MIFRYKFLDLYEISEFCEYIENLEIEAVANIGKNREVDAKSLVGMTLLGAGQEVTIRVTGEENEVLKVKWWLDIHQKNKPYEQET